MSKTTIKPNELDEALANLENNNNVDKGNAAQINILSEQDDAVSELAETANVDKRMAFRIIDERRKLTATAIAREIAEQFRDVKGNNRLLTVDDHLNEAEYPMITFMSKLPNYVILVTQNVTLTFNNHSLVANIPEIIEFVRALPDFGTHIFEEALPKHIIDELEARSRMLERVSMEAKEI